MPFLFLMIQLSELSWLTLNSFSLDRMNFKQKLAALKASIDNELARHFDVAIKDAKKNDPLMAEALEHMKKIALAGGKRIRGALLIESYLGFGGKEKKKILKVAAAIEMVHLFLLAHDDIIDRGDSRHGKMVLHKMLAKKYQKKYGTVEAQHFGDSMAIIVGDMLYVIANAIIAEAGFDGACTLGALSKLQTIVSTTIIGQSQDLHISYDDNIGEQQILSMYENKTARYTFEGPLHMGAILAGCNDKKSLDLLSGYAVPLGIAFQIQDDILGVFGDVEKIGKSAASDIEEGKKTLMVMKAFQAASRMQKEQLSAVLGKKGLKVKDIKMFQELLIATGALEYNKMLAKKYFDTGKKEIEKIIILSEAKKFLLGAVEYLEKRET